MAIEFNCPYCTATIRVPDAYAGKQGRCPKCDTKILIPNVPLPNQTGPGNQSSTRNAPTAGIQSTIPPQMQSGSPGFNSQPPFPAETPLAPGQAPPGANASVAPADDPFAVRPVTNTAKSRRRRARRRPSRALVIGVPVICFLVLFGIIAYSLMDSLPQLHGNLPARKMDGLMLPPTTIPWSEIGSSEADRKALQQELTTHPETLTSQVISCRISGSNEGMVVTLSSTPESQWIVVDTSLEKPLAIWRRKEGPQLNLFRLEEMQAALAVYARDKLLKANGKQIAIDGAMVRDKVALNASGGPLSYAVHAIVDSTIFPCAAEDGPGHLYFCLPKNVTSFRIVGRTIGNASIGFAGDYSVLISHEIVTTKEAASSDKPDAGEKNMESGEVQPDEMMPEAGPDMTDEKPKMSDDDPDMTDEKPKMSDDDPGMADEKPGMSAAKPKMSDEESDMSKPEMSKPDAEMMESK